MTEALFRTDPHAREAEARVTAITPEGGLAVDRSVFYPQGGGQPGDSGWLRWAGGRIVVTNAVRGEGGAVVLLPEPGAALPPPGTAVRQELDWGRRHLHMRVHTALHLLSVVLPFPVTGGQIGAGRGRLDFAMADAPVDRAALEEALNALVARDLPVTEDWITDEELAANPGLVRTLSVRPPAGQGRVRLVRIGQGAEQVDLQPCGGTHVARTGEIGRILLGKVESKGRQNRRVAIALEGV
ncbi:MAG: alanyl-tRNA editing protein [Rhodobacteraceae bacterium]|nr:alanyl-tRNA editing protein [Paracoccaceae bacterium]